MSGARSLARGSVLAGTARRAADRLRTAFAGSWIGAVLATIGAPVAALATARADGVTDPRDGTVSSVETAVERSVAAGAVRRLATTLQQAASGATIARAAGTATAYVREAWLYRWLTTEPEPAVVVIDLRATRSVGPPLAVVDRVVDAIVPGVEGATVVRTIERGADVVHRRPVAIASGLVLGAATASLLAAVASGEPGHMALLARLAIAGIAALGLRSKATLADLRETRPARLLVAALEPPDPPEGRSVGSEPTRPVTDDSDGQTPESTTEAEENAGR